MKGKSLVSRIYKGGREEKRLFAFYYHQYLVMFDQVKEHFSTGYLPLPTSFNLGKTVETEKKPKSRKYPVLLAIFSILVVAGYSYGWLFSNDVDTACLNDFSLNNVLQSVQCHHYKAKRLANQMMQQQSTTYESAVEEYKRRYYRDPPRGFEKWYHWTKENGGQIIDEFDGINVTFSQFRHVKPDQMRANLQRATHRNYPQENFTWADGELKHPYEMSEGKKFMVEALKKILPAVPDFQFVLNWDDREALGGPTIDPSSYNKDPLATDSKHDENRWFLLTATCPQQYVSEKSLLSDRPSIDVCQHINSSVFINSVAELRQPSSAISNLLPIFSWSKYTTARDILVPYWGYFTPKDRGWNSGDDVLPFQQKNDTIFWRGSSTGSKMDKDVWQENSRIRISNYFSYVRAILPKMKDVRTDSSRISTILADMRLADTNDNRKLLAGLKAENFDIGVSTLLQCDDGKGCIQASRYNAQSSRGGVTDERNSKFVFDIDGNSMSVRFYRLLESNSLVFKQTYQAEWHDDILIPWYHYIPVDAIAPQHLLQLVHFFLHNDRGKMIAEAIAANGRKAAKEILRVEDMTSYWYRLILEYISLF